MQPYYQDADATLYLGDCRDVLPQLPAESVDLLLTDPPYGVKWNSGHRNVPFGHLAGDDGMLPILSILLTCLKVLRNSCHVYVFGLTDWGDLPIGGRSDLVWDKGLLGMGDLSLPWAPSHERIAFGVYLGSKANREDGKGRLAARLRRGSVLRCHRPNGTAVTLHPTEKPVSILRQMIEASSLMGDSVLDPFAGSGSTLVAAKLEGRRSIGVEIEERYAEVAARRLSQQVMPLEV